MFDPLSILAATAIIGLLETRNRNPSSTDEPQRPRHTQPPQEQRRQAEPATVGNAHRIKIKGDDRFKSQVNKALGLLQQHCPEDYEFVNKKLRTIEPGNETGVWMGSRVQIREDSPYFTNARSMAGMLRHEAEHSRDVPLMPTANELRCNEAQAKVLDLLGASGEAAQIRSQDGRHWQQDGSWY